MIKIIGVTAHKKGNLPFMQLKFKLPNGKDSSIALAHTGNITHGTIISTMVVHFGINPNEVQIPIHIERELPIQV